MKVLTPQEKEEYLKACIDIFPEQLQEEFVRTPADMAYWGREFADAARARDMSKLLTKRVRAQVEKAVRAAPRAAGEKAPTEATVAAAVETDAGVIAAEEAEADAEYQVAVIKGTLDAIRAKRDMLIQLGAQQRLEMESDPLIRQRIVARRDMLANG